MGEATPTSEHDWQRAVVGSEPCMRCARCGYVWRPDMRVPSRPCRKADKWRSIADQLADALGKVSTTYTEADKNRRADALARYREAAR